MTGSWIAYVVGISGVATYEVERLSVSYLCAVKILLDEPVLCTGDESNHLMYSY